MKMTVSEKGKKTYIKVNDESFISHPETLIKYHRYINQEIDLKTLNALKADNLYFHTFSKALKKLSYKAYSQKALEEALKDAPIHIVKQVITELKSLGYLDDLKLLKQYREDFFYQAYALKSYQIKLIQKGFIKQDIEKAFETIDVNEKERCLEILNKKVSLFSKEPLQKQKEKLKRYGLSLGYSYDVIDGVLSTMTFSTPNEIDLLEKELKKYPKPKDYQEKEKLKAKLFRRGYQLSDIEKALKEDS